MAKMLSIGLWFCMATAASAKEAVKIPLISLSCEPVSCKDGPGYQVGQWCESKPTGIRIEGIGSPSGASLLAKDEKSQLLSHQHPVAKLEMNLVMIEFGEGDQYDSIEIDARSLVSLKRGEAKEVIVTRTDAFSWDNYYIRSINTYRCSKIRELNSQ